MRLPEWSKPLFELGGGIDGKGYRYKVSYGGRGGGKTSTYARVLAVICTQQALKVMCCRQFQNTMDDSVRPAIEAAIIEYGFKDAWQFLDNELKCKNGSVIHFKGIDRNIMSIKGWEGYDICWVEEANTLKREALELLRPTLRKDGSELWFSFNRHDINDPVDKFFLGATPPENAYIVKVNYYDNPFFPHTLEVERQQFKKEQPERYGHIWLGEPDMEQDMMLVSPSAIQRAIDNQADGFDDSPLVIGADPARLGGDRFALCYRRGRHVLGFEVLPKSNLVDAAGRLGEIILKHNPKRMFIDVGGLGVGVYDILRANGHGHVTSVNFGGKPLDNQKYYNKRSEMYGTTVDWFNDPQGVSIKGESKFSYAFMSDMSMITRGYTPAGALKLPPKEELFKKGFKSPDIADAFALTFAEPVANHAIINQNISRQPRQCIGADIQFI